MATKKSRLRRLTAYVLVGSFIVDPFALATLQATTAAGSGVVTDLPRPAWARGIDLASPPAVAATAAATPEDAPAGRDREQRDIATSFATPRFGSARSSEGAAACAANLTGHLAPLVSLVKTQLWPPNHSLVDVGLGVDVTAPCEGRVTTRVAVFADEPDDSSGDGSTSDDARIAGTALYLRSERRGNGDGRVYLILTTSTLPDGTEGAACATVTVPKSRSRSDLAGVAAQAAAAQAYCDAQAAPPASYFPLTEGVLALANVPPVVSAGPDQAVDFPGTATLAGTATDDGRPNGTLSVSWSQVDGPAGGTVTFSSPGTAETTASFSATGTYTLRLTASDGQFTASDDAVVVVAVANQAPQVDAGPDREITLPEDTVTLDGTATDDGRPLGSQLAAAWSVVSPAGAAVTFADAHAAETTATLPGAGEYILRLTASDGQFTVSDDMRVTVHAQPPPVLQIEDATATEGHEGTTAAVVALTLSYAWPQPVTVDFLTEDGSAVAGCDYRTAFGTITFAPGETAAEVLVPIAGELAPEADETVRLRFDNVSQATLARSEATLTILNDDAANAPPGALSDRAPADRANGVTLPPTLTWSAVDPDAGDVLIHDVHLGTSFATSGQSWARTCPANQGPGPRTAPVAGYDEANDRLMLFGGTDTTDGSLWILDNASGAGGPSRWTSIPTAGGPVGLGHAASVYDAATNRLFVVGGCSGECLSGSDQSWILSHANGLGGTPAWSLLSGAGPGPRIDPAAALDPATRRLIVFGGSNAGSSLGDVWLLPLDGLPAWQALPIQGSGPARSGMTASYDGERNRLVLFGGRAGTQAWNDTWVLHHANGSGGSAEWSRLAPAGTAPPPRWGHVAAYDPVSGRLVVYGGRTASANPAARFVFRDVWMLTGVAGEGTPEWTRLNPNAGPAGQAQAAGAFSAAANRMVVLGGASSTAPATDEIWVLSEAIGTLPLVSSDPATSLTPGGLVPGEVYFWRIVSRDDHGAARGSTAWRFTSNAPPSVEAGPDQTITLPASVITLHGTGTDDGLPAGSLTFTWTASGPGPVVFGDASAAGTTASFAVPGTYVLRLTLSDSQLSASDELTVTVLPQAAANQQPQVDAGANQEVLLPLKSAALAGTASDDGLPRGAALRYQWTKVSGPGTVIFSAPTSLSTSATFSTTGDYTLQLEADDSELKGSDSINVSVRPRADLGVAEVDVTGMSVDGQTLAVSGAVSAMITNLGQGPAARPFTVVFFEDLDADGVLDASDTVLGSASLASLDASASSTVSAPVSGLVTFAGNVVHALVDSTNAIAESDESNNYAQSGPPCANAPGPRPFAPRLEWSWTSSANVPASVQVIMSPVVVDLDGDGIPDVAFSTFAGTTYTFDGHLRAVNGATGQELFTVTNALYDVDPVASPAVGDLDGDGRPEIVTVHESQALIAFEHDGTFKWLSPLLATRPAFQYGGPALADLDGDGTPEIVMGREVFNANGTVRWKGTAGQGDNNGEGPLAIVADLDLDGVPEVIAGNTAYRATGTVFWQNMAVGDGFTAVGNFDADSNPEIVVVHGGRVWLLEHTGAVKWGPVSLPAPPSTFPGQGGAPTVADFDGDGQVEIGVAGGHRYAVFETNGTLKWAAVTQDFTSHKTGSSVFDFEGDGRAEVVYADELKLRVYRGTDGTVLWETPRPNGTTYDLPVIADVDGDGRAEILVTHGNAGNSPSWGLRVYGDDNWVATRPIWNQHTYHITNVNDDGTIPPRETNSWTKYNSYRQNRLTRGCEFARPDLTASYVRSADSAGSLVLTARIGNGGGSTVAAGVPVSFYDRDPATAGTRIAAAVTPGALAPGRFVDVSVTVPATTVALPLWVVADDQGGLVGTIAEFDETNNAYNSRLFLSPTANTSPTVGAGPDQWLVHPQRTAVLDATATDDGLPRGQLTTQWGVAQRPEGATVTFSDATAVDTMATFSAAGTYVLSLAANDGQLMGSDEVAIVVEPPNQAPVVDAGADQEILLPLKSAALAGTVGDDGLPRGAALTYQWTKVSGPGTVTFSAPTALATTATFSTAGEYMLALEANDSDLKGSDSVNVSVRPRADLGVASVDVTGLLVDGQTLAVSGAAGATITNLGQGPAATPFTVVFFEDLDADGALDAGDTMLGSTSLTFLDAGASSTVSASVSGQISFVGAILHAFVDSTNAIAESDESNNYAKSGPPCANAPGPRPFTAELEWSWTSSTVQPGATNVMNTPMVADLDGDGRPEVIFSSFSGHGGIILSEDGYLRVLDGATGAERFTVTNPAQQVAGLSSTAVGDIDGDGRPEIIAVALSGDKLIAFEHDGSFKWQSPVLESPGWGGAALADLDSDGQPEILVGRTVLNGNGTIRWKGTGGKGEALTGGRLIGSLSLAVDLDGNGSLEVVAGNTAYRNDGTILWQVPAPDGLNAVGNFDADSSPEIVLVESGQVRLIEHDGTLKWGPLFVPGACGSPVVADMDGDGVPEIGVAGVSRYTALRADGTVKWSVPIQDASSHVTGSSVFDFEGDGAAEVVYADEIALRVFRGTDGAVLFEQTLGSCTAFENPVIADVDADGKAEIVAIANRCSLPNHGIFVFGSPDWVSTRRIWNQHTYHITNVNDDGTIPPRETNSWTRYNSYRQNRLTTGCEYAKPDLTASYVRRTESGSDIVLTARIGNGGGSTVAAGVPVSFYDRDPATVGTRLATVATPGALAPGKFVDVSVMLPAATVARPLWVVSDDRGGLVGTIDEFDEANNAYDSRLFLSPTSNAGPEVDAGPDQRLVFPQKTANLDGTATDDGAPLGQLTTRWLALQRPDGATVTFADVMAVDTTATFSTAGTYILRLTADDGQSQGSDEVTIVVEAPNQAPVVDAGPSQSITQPTTALDGTVTDDGLPTGSIVAVQWSKREGPGTAVFADASAVDTTVTFDQEGHYVLQLSASDSAATGSDTVAIDVEFANAAPVVNAGPDHTLTLPASSLTLTGTATDDGLPLGSMLRVQWSAVVSPGVVTFGAPAAPETTATFSDPGVYVLKLTASDGAKHGSDQVQVTVGSAAPAGNAPEVALAAPLDGARVTAPIPVVGTAIGDSLASWKLEYRLESDTTYTRFAAGTTAVTAGVLGTFDPSLLLNGLYEVRLTATDTAGRNSRISVQVVVKDNLKVGHFSVSFVDLDVPVSGLPIRVTRTYDSRDKGKGDFGIGWHLDMSNVRLAEKGVVGLAFEGTRSSGPFPTYCLQLAQPQVVTVTLTDGTVYEFQPVLTRPCQQFAPPEDGNVAYQPLPGTHAKLQAAGDGYVFVSGSWPGDMELYDGSSFEIYDPDDYVLTLADGTQLSLNQAAGLTQVKDLNGNTLEVSSSGITHSSGRGISFVRDAQGRITRVTDPDNHSMTYGYDAAGDLVSFTDRETHTTTFTYNADQPHLLEAIKDPRGRQPIRNDYYDDGRIKSHTDAFGKTITYAHDVVGRQEVITDRDGGVRVLEFDDRGNVVRETDPEGKVVDRTFDARNNRTSETLPHDPGVTNAPKTTYVYDAQDDLRSVTDPENQTTEYTYNARKQVVLMKDPRGTYTVNAYDSRGNLFSTKTSTSPTGMPVLSELSSTYRADGNLETRTETVDGVACVARYEYDGSGNLIKETDGLGHATTFTYDASGNRLNQSTTRTTPAGVETLVTSYSYDKLGRLLRTTDADTTFTETVYDEAGRQKETRDKLGRVTKYDYDDMGRLVLTAYPDLTTEAATYDGEGRRLTFKDRADRVTKFQYDKLGRLTRTTYPDETFTENVYDPAGRLKEAKDARGNATLYGYDTAGRRTSVKVPLGGGAFAETTFTYDANGNQKTVRDANLHTVTYDYDELNRRTKTIFPDGTYTETTYDILGRRRAERDQAGKLTKFDYDCLGRLTAVTQRNDGVDLVTHYEYDEAGNRILQRDANDHETRFEYDKLGRETARTLPDGKTETKIYWPTGSLKTRTDFMGRTTSYDYDENERLTTRTYPAGTLPAVSFTYTPTGRRKTVTVAGATTQYEYDLRDRLKTLAYPDGRTLEYGYDGNGNRTTLKATVGGQTITMSFLYDPANRLDVVTDPAGRTYDHDYDSAGNRKSLTYPNGVTTAYDYDDLNRLRDLSTTHTTTGVRIQSYGFTLGLAGNRTKITEGDGTVREYGYDDLYRLTSEKVTIGALPQYEKTFTYDAVGNRLTQTTNGAGAAGTPLAAGSLAYGYDSRDRLVTESGTRAGEPVGIRYGYDDNGNLITKSGEATYVWDVENRLIRAETGPVGNTTVVTYAYDADGNRLQTRVTPPTGPPTVTNDLVDTSGFLSHVVAETDDGGLFKAYYLRGDELLAVMRPLVIAPATPGWQTRFVHADGIGSIRRLTNESGGITDGYTYTAFGERIAHTGTDPQRYAFAGEPYDPNIGFQYHRARWMDPQAARFLSIDVLRGDEFAPFSLHRYFYAGNDPNGKLDPTGLFFSPVQIGAALTTLSNIATRAVSVVIPLVYWFNVHYFTIQRLVDRTRLVLDGAAATVGVGEILVRMVENLENANVAYSAGSGTRGMQVGHAAQQNLGDFFPEIDHVEQSAAVQIKSTTAIKDSKVLLRQIESDAFRLSRSNRVLSGRDALGNTVSVDMRKIPSRGLLVVIPAEDVRWSVPAFFSRIRQIEQQYNVMIAVARVRGLRGP